MISRRNLLHHGATAALLAGTAVAAVQCVPDEAPAAEMASTAMLAAIAEHQRASAVWMVAIDACGARDEDVCNAVNKARANGASDAECNALRYELKAAPSSEAVDARYDETSKAEGDALGALVDVPVASIADLREKLEYLSKLPDPEDCLGIVDDRITRLMRSILNGGLV